MSDVRDLIAEARAMAENGDWGLDPHVRDVVNRLADECEGWLDAAMTSGDALDEAERETRFLRKHNEAPSETTIAVYKENGALRTRIQRIRELTTATVDYFDRLKDAVDE